MASAVEADMMDPVDPVQPAGSRLLDMPNEILTPICNLVAATDASDVWSLHATCRQFGSLLSENEQQQRVSKAALESMSTTEKIILSHIMKFRPWENVFEWVRDTQRIAANIETGLEGLKNIGVHTEIYLAFMVPHPRTEANIDHTDRVLRTILIAIELVNPSSGQIFNFDDQNLPNASCTLLTAFFLRLEPLSKIIAQKLRISIDNRRSPSVVLEHSSTPLPQLPPKKLKKKAAVIRSMLLNYGGSALYHLLGNTSHVLEFHGRRFAESLARNMKLPNKRFAVCVEDSATQIFARLSSKILSQPGKELRRLGLDLPGYVDLDVWKRAVPGDATWEQLMLGQGWTKNLEALKAGLSHAPAPTATFLTKIQRDRRPSQIPVRAPALVPKVLPQPQAQFHPRFQAFSNLRTAGPNPALIRYLVQFGRSANDFHGITTSDKVFALEQIINESTGPVENLNYDKLPLPQRWLHGKRMENFCNDNYGEGIFQFSVWDPSTQTRSPATERNQNNLRRKDPKTTNMAIKSEQDVDVVQGGDAGQ